MSTRKLTALLSAYDKTGVAEFAQQLVVLGWDILASGGTAKLLTERGICVTDIATFVGPPILGHRVVTLSREIHAALLATDSEADQAELAKIGIPRIDLVYVDLYPLEAAIAGALSLGQVIERTDIGGPTMLRSAAKGRRIVIHHSSQFPDALTFIEDRKSLTVKEDEQLISLFASEAEKRVSEYCRASADYLHSHAIQD